MSTSPTSSSARAGSPYELGDPGRLDDSKPAGSYWVDYNYSGNSVYGKWFYRADDEVRTFDISYVVHDAVTVYDDNAQLYWKLIGENWDVPAREVTGTIHLPHGRRQGPRARVAPHGADERVLDRGRRGAASRSTTSGRGSSSR